MTLLSDFEQSNLRRGYDGIEGSRGCQDRLCSNSDADETLAKWESREKCYVTFVKKSIVKSLEKILASF